MIRQTMAEACDQSASNGSSGDRHERLPRIGNGQKNGEIEVRFAQSGSDFGGNLIQDVSDDFSLGVGFCGFYDLGHCVVLR
jgi:hypothetical protein